MVDNDGKCIGCKIENRLMKKGAMEALQLEAGNASRYRRNTCSRDA